MIGAFRKEMQSEAFRNETCVDWTSYVAFSVSSAPLGNSMLKYV